MTKTSDEDGCRTDTWQQAAFASCHSFAEELNQMVVDPY